MLQHSVQEIEDGLVVESMEVVEHDDQAAELVEVVGQVPGESLDGRPVSPVKKVESPPARAGNRLPDRGQQIPEKGPQVVIAFVQGEPDARPRAAADPNSITQGKVGWLRRPQRSACYFAPASSMAI